MMTLTSYPRASISRALSNTWTKQSGSPLKANRAVFWVIRTVSFAEHLTQGRARASTESRSTPARAEWGKPESANERITEWDSAASSRSRDLLVLSFADSSILPFYYLYSAGFTVTSAALRRPSSMTMAMPPAVRGRSVSVTSKSRTPSAEAMMRLPSTRRVRA